MKGAEPQMRPTSCEPGASRVVKQLDDAGGSCGRGQDRYWEVATSGSGAWCLEFIYIEPVYSAELGECAMGLPDTTDWTMVECGDRTFRVLSVNHGSADKSFCQGDHRVTMWKNTEQFGRPAIVCLQFDYGDDRGALPVGTCVSVDASGTAVTLHLPKSCQTANATVTGWKRTVYDPSLCGNDGYVGWQSPDPVWTKYLDFTLCWRWI